MNALFAFARAVDWLTDRFGSIAKWAVFLSCFISAGNAVVRYALDISSNAWLEIQWQMFAGIFLLGSAHVLKLNEHVRVDLLYTSVSDRARTWIDLTGTLLFLAPFCIIMIYFSWGWFLESFLQNEMSQNAGGLPRWPLKFFLPFGFFLILLQGISELIKCIHSLATGQRREHAYEKPVQ